MNKILQLKSISEANGEFLPIATQEQLKKSLQPTVQHNIVCPVVLNYELHRVSDAVNTEIEE